MLRSRLYRRIFKRPIPHFLAFFVLFLMGKIPQPHGSKNLVKNSINFSDKFQIFHKNAVIRGFYSFFSVRVVAGSFSSERAQKMLNFGVLDVSKFNDTAENEAFEVPKM